MARYIDIDSLGVGRKNRDVFNVPELADGWNSLYDLLEEAPTADVAEVKHGEWETELDELDWNKHTCTNCGYVKRTDIHVSLGWNYCPKCGAIMDGGKAE